MDEWSVGKTFQRQPNHHDEKTNALSNKASLGTYLTLALGAGAFSGHNAHAAVVISPVNETSINDADPIFITFSNGVISSGQGTGSQGVGGIARAGLFPARGGTAGVLIGASAEPFSVEVRVKRG